MRTTTNGCDAFRVLDTLLEYCKSTLLIAADIQSLWIHVRDLVRSCEFTRVCELGNHLLGRGDRSKHICRVDVFIDRVDKWSQMLSFTLVVKADVCLIDNHVLVLHFGKDRLLFDRLMVTALRFNIGFITRCARPLSLFQGGTGAALI